MILRGITSGGVPAGWLPALPAIPIGLVSAVFADGLGRDWRLIISSSPLDPGPAAGMLLLALVAATSVVAGLALTVATRWPIAPSLFALGVGLICGAAFGFVSGPAGVQHLPIMGG